MKSIVIKSIALAYSDYANIKGTIVSDEGDSYKVAVPLKSFTEEDERELHHEGDVVHVKVKKEAVK